MIERGKPCPIRQLSIIISGSALQTPPLINIYNAVNQNCALSHQHVIAFLSRKSGTLFEMFLGTKIGLTEEQLVTLVSTSSFESTLRPRLTQNNCRRSKR
ncbi:hypothetical protein J6590_072209 [Homalodisca vitripennis]|nr:hypothetical protein J6590_072209 [Homalodisca vitripennis]